MRETGRRPIFYGLERSKDGFKNLKASSPILYYESNDFKVFKIIAILDIDLKFILI